MARFSAAMVPSAVGWGAGHPATSRIAERRFPGKGSPASSLQKNVRLQLRNRSYWQIELKKAVTPPHPKTCGSWYAMMRWRGRERSCAAGDSAHARPNPHNKKDVVGLSVDIDRGSLLIDRVLHA
jgi:hypothetical protein